MLRTTIADIRDLSAIDTKSLTPAQWDAFKREVVRRAHAGRSRLMRDLIAQVFAAARPSIKRPA